MMAFNKFTLLVLLQVVLIAVTGLIMVWSFYQSHLMVARVTFTLIWIGQITGLLSYVTRTNRSLSIFLDSLRASDYVRRHDDAPSFDALNLSYNDIIDVVKNARMEREAQYHYFQYTLELIPVGIISFNQANGRVEIFNTASQRLLGLKYLSVIDDLDRIRPGLAGIIKGLDQGHNRVITLHQGFQPSQVIMRATNFNLFGRSIQVVSLQNIRRALEEEQLYAWQKLISVLRHEIMNSVGPVSSLSRTLLRMFRNQGTNKKSEEITNKTIDDAVTGLESIESRTEGMMRFVQSYREMTKIPQPLKKTHQADELLKQMSNLMKEHLNDKNIELIIDPPGSIYHVDVDEKQIIQVLINLVKNAAEAFPSGQKEKRITLQAYRDDDHTRCIAVEDNGQGIAADLQEKIFVPFFTTKEEGSGIGLNFARQIMHLHQGRIAVSSEGGKGSRFVLEFDG